MHRDLKPLNILLSINLHVRITDFGLAKEEDLADSQSKGVGTRRFMAPEIFEENDEGSTYTSKVDVYSFGITLIIIVTCSCPKFNLKNSLIVIIRPLPDTIVALVRELIVRYLSQSPEERPTFSEILEIMKSNDYDIFNEKKSSKLSPNQDQMKNEIEKRILKIEAFEYQLRDD
ncbi:hypothetical protein M9Y10_033285 [Tritrichomonas musculus]|uniref:Protein kinase domain-containing protein n=1 Tax=Tritrichomonas musculus TaxID=1915356 RepID=A0ABR2KBQ7_9EUKA